MSSGFERLRSRYIRRAAAAIDMGHSKALKNVWELKLCLCRKRKDADQAGPPFALKVCYGLPGLRVVARRRLTFLAFPGRTTSA